MDTLITAKQLRKHVYYLAETIGERNIYQPDALHAAEVYIKGAWNKLGYNVTSQEYVVGDIRCNNLEISLPGSAHPEEIILLGAHYDSVKGSPGANDNGSGVAALLELSRLFNGIEPDKTIRFVAFTNEEPPFFFFGQQGSLIYARAARQHGDDIRLMISLETIGCYSDKPYSQAYPPLFRFFYPNRGNFIAFVTNFRSRSAMRKLAQAFRTSTSFPMEHIATFSLIPGVSWSDHLSFWRQGYPALMVTDTAFYRYPYYHSAHDTPEKLNYDEFARMANGLFEALILLTKQAL